jgi:hypothetical protein
MIQWVMNTGGHSFDNVRISTTLPNGVDWADSASPDVIYDAATHTVSYEADQIVADSDQTLAFGVTVTPKAGQVGNMLPLTTETTVVAVDRDTASNVSSSVTAVSTPKAVVSAK